VVALPAAELLLRWHAHRGAMASSGQLRGCIWWCNTHVGLVDRALAVVSGHSLGMLGGDVLLRAPKKEALEAATGLTQRAPGCNIP
jgi:hypothetical protein